MTPPVDVMYANLPWMPSAHGLGQGRNYVSRKSIEKRGIPTFVPEDTPFHKKYFARENMMKYPPLAEALKNQDRAPEEKKEEAQQEVNKAMQGFFDTSWCSNWDYKKYDIVIYGASGYTGYLIMEYLKKEALPNNQEKFTVALAGRSYEKVEAARDRVFAGTPWEDMPILTCKYDNLASVIDLCRSARVIVNVAGPYSLTEGDLLVDCCIYHKTDYLDVCGEVPYIHRVFKLHKQAKAAGVIVSPSAGMATVSDVGVQSIARKFREEYGEDLRYGRTFFASSQNNASSGGTLATQKAMREMGEDVVELMQDVFSFGGYIPDLEYAPGKLTNMKQGYVMKDGKCVPAIRKEDQDFVLSAVEYDKQCECWRAPIYFTFFETRIIRRSNMLMAEYLGKPYCEQFNYISFAHADSKKVALEKAKMLNVTDAKTALEKKGKYYGAGEGPPLEELEDAWMMFRSWGQSASGKTYRMSVRGKDGYYETARAAICLALTLRFDRLKLPIQGGALTGAVAGGAYLERRIFESGVIYKLGEWESLEGLGTGLPSPDE